jgi:hypothetical protein
MFFFVVDYYFVFLSRFCAAFICEINYILPMFSAGIGLDLRKNACRYVGVSNNIRRVGVAGRRRLTTI